MKIAVLIAGEFREFSIAHKFWSFLNWSDVDCYFSTWDKSYMIPSSDADLPILEIITDQTIRDILPNAKINISSYAGDRFKHWHSASLMLNRWKSVLNLLLHSENQYDRVFLIRPDLALNFDEEIFKKFIYTHPIDDSSLHGLTGSGGIDKNQNVLSIGKMSDLMLIGTQNGILKLLELPDDNLQTSWKEYKSIDIHSYLAANCGTMFSNMFNSPIDDWCIVRSNCRGKPHISFNECKERSRDWWETKFKRYSFMSNNNWQNKPKVLPINQIKTASINLWDKYDLDPWQECQRSLQWKVPDSEERFDVNSKSEKFKDNVTYTKTDIQYSYDSYGFRRYANGPPEAEESNCDRYQSIMFAGCSVTEGIGLPEKHIWHSFMTDMLRPQFEKVLLPFNFGKGGISIDTITRIVYNTIQNRDYHPDMVCLLLPPIHRQEFILFNGHSWTTWNMLPQLPPSNNQHIVYTDLYNKHFDTTPRQLIHNCFRNLLLLKWLLKEKNIPWYFGFWANDLDDKYLDSNMGTNNFDDLKIPKELNEHYIPIHIKYDNDMNPDQLKFSQNIARDYMHYGPNTHLNLAQQYYNGLMSKESFTKSITTWRKK